MINDEWYGCYSVAMLSTVVGKNSSLNDALQMPLARSGQRNMRLCFATDVGQRTCQLKIIISNASFIIKLQHLGLRHAWRVPCGQHPPHWWQSISVWDSFKPLKGYLGKNIYSHTWDLKLFQKRSHLAIQLRAEGVELM